VHGLDRARGDEKRGFLDWASKSTSTVCQWFGLKITGTVCQWFDLKTIGTVSPGLALKPVVAVFSGLASKLVTIVFFGLASKPAAIISLGLTLKSVVSFLVEPQKQGGREFPALTFKTGNYNLLIWASKSPRWFFCLSHKTKLPTVYRLRHKTDIRATAWDTHRDLTTCFTCKQVMLWFHSLVLRLADAW
jgi:hypothetical protein